jgi:hypothetical protein
MKNLFYCVLLALIVIIYSLQIELFTRYADLKRDADFQKAIMKTRLEQIEKELRIAKQDILILEGGFKDE